MGSPTRARHRCAVGLEDHEAVVEELRGEDQIASGLAVGARPAGDATGEGGVDLGLDGPDAEARLGLHRAVRELDGADRAVTAQGGDLTRVVGDRHLEAGAVGAERVGDPHRETGPVGDLGVGVADAQRSQPGGGQLGLGDLPLAGRRRLPVALDEGRGHEQDGAVALVAGQHQALLGHHHARVGLQWAADLLGAVGLGADDDDRRPRSRRPPRT